MSIQGNNIAPDILGEIFKSLDYKELIIASKTCKAWNKAASAKTLWKNLVTKMILSDAGQKYAICRFSGKNNWKKTYQDLFPFTISHVAKTSSNSMFVSKKIFNGMFNNAAIMAQRGAMGPIVTWGSGKIVKLITASIVKTTTRHFFNGEATGALLGGTVSIVSALAIAFFFLISGSISFYQRDDGTGFYSLAGGAALSSLGIVLLTEYDTGSRTGLVFLCAAIFFSMIRR